MGVLQAGLVPGSYVGMGNHGTGCFTPQMGVTKGEQNSKHGPPILLHIGLLFAESSFRSDSK